MTVPNRPTIALDIGNVCISIHPERCFSSLGISSSTEVPEHFLQAVYKMETGIITEDEWLDIFAEATSSAYSKNKLRQAYIEILGDEFKSTEDFVRFAVGIGYRIIFFSDTSPIHIHSIYRNLSYANLITGGVYSFNTGKLKPHRAMYDQYEKLYGIPAVYIDDKPENIEAAEKRGWESILYKDETDIEKCREILQVQSTT